MADWWQLTQGGSKVRHQSSLCWNAPVNQTIVGGALVGVMSHRQASEIGSIWDDLTRLNTGWIFIIKGWLCVYTLPHTFQFKLLVKVHVASNDPLSWRMRLNVVKLEKWIACVNSLILTPLVIMDLYFSLKNLDGFVSDFVFEKKKTLTDGLFLSDSHSDGTHSLQSIHCWDTDAVTHFSKSDEETNSSFPSDEEW